MTNVAEFRGRLLDVDSHEMTPLKRWGDAFGDTGELFSQILLSFMKEGQVPAGGLNDLLTELLDDTTEITDGSVWRRENWERGSEAPGAMNMSRRGEVLDCMGVHRQLVFPGFALIGVALLQFDPTKLASAFGLEDTGLGDPTQLKMFGKMIVRAHNDWIEKQLGSGLDADRIRLVAVVPTDDLGEMMTETERVLAAGARALLIPASVPPGGYSPADRALQPFWSLCEDSNAAVLMHIAHESLMATDTWKNVPEFEADTVVSSEFVLDPWSLSTLHMVVENFITTMVLGGVFERHPDLRVGAIECGANWVGPMAQNLDLWGGVFSRRMSKILSQPPSAYIERNVRVSPFIFEPVPDYINRYGMEGVYCYGSDYPHIEGGTDQVDTFYKTLEPLGPGVLEKFFVENGQWLMPSINGREG